MEKVQALWIGATLPELQQKCLASFVAVGMGVDLYTYEPVAGVPTGVTICDGTTILPAAKIWHYRNTGSHADTPAGFSLHFRYALLAQKGGWWVDADVLCLKSFDLKQDVAIASEQIGPRLEYRSPEPCVLKFPAGHDVLQAMLVECEAADPATARPGHLGRLLLRRTIDRIGLAACVVPGDVFCPREPTPASLARHHWATARPRKNAK